MKKNIIIGNWKMNLALDDARELMVGIRQGLNDNLSEEVDIVVCPTHIHISSVAYLMPKGTYVGAQNCFWEDFGSYTGEVSVAQLKDIKCKYVILGHSERRMYLGENYINVNKKLISCIGEGLIPVICIGESLEEKRQRKTKEVLEMQLRKAFVGVKEEHFENIVIAYEPIWAIGTGKNADPDDAETVAKFIKKVISDIVTMRAAESLRVIYGGSVDHKNIANFMKENNIDGSLVGGASIKATSFVNIIKNSVK